MHSLMLSGLHGIEYLLILIIYSLRSVLYNISANTIISLAHHPVCCISLISLQ